MTLTQPIKPLDIRECSLPRNTIRKVYTLCISCVCYVYMTSVHYAYTLCILCVCPVYTLYWSCVQSVLSCVYSVFVWCILYIGLVYTPCLFCVFSLYGLCYTSVYVLFIFCIKIISFTIHKHRYCVNIVHDIASSIVHRQCVFFTISVLIDSMCLCCAVCDVHLQLNLFEKRQS